MCSLGTSHRRIFLVQACWWQKLLGYACSSTTTAISICSRRFGRQEAGQRPVELVEAKASVREELKGVGMERLCATARFSPQRGRTGESPGGACVRNKSRGTRLYRRDLCFTMQSSSPSPWPSVRKPADARRAA